MVDTKCGGRVGIRRSNADMGSGWRHSTGELEMADVLAGRGLRNPAVHENSEELADGQTKYGDSNGR